MSDFEEQYSNDFFKEYFFVEKVSAQKLWAIINCDEAVIHTKKWWEDQEFTTQYGDTISCEKEHLKNILDTVKRNEKNGDLEITTQYFSTKQYGRVYPKNGMSLGMLRREIRHYICDDIYYDIDMINAHPTIALGLCEKWGIDCKALESYVNNREDKLNKYSNLFEVSRSDVKQMFCSMLNGGSWTNFIADLKGKEYEIVEGKATKYLDTFKRNCKHICKKFKKKIPKAMYNEITKHKALKRAKNRTFIAIFLQIYEEKILRLLFGLLEEKKLVQFGYARCVLCHDGAMIEKSLFDDNSMKIEDFIVDLNELVMEEMGFKCDFKLKEFDERHKTKEILDQHIRKQKENNEAFINPDDDYVDPWVQKYGIWKSDIVEATDTSLAGLYYTMNKNKYVGCNNKLFKKNEYGLYQSTTDKGMRKEYMSYLKDFIDFEDKKCSSYHEFVDLLCERFYINSAEETHEGKYIQIKKCEPIRRSLEKSGQILKKNTNTLLSKLSNNKGLKDIVATLISMYDDDDFAEKLDVDPKLLGFNNGVIDLESSDVFVVRNAQDGEYVSMTCGYDFFIDGNVKKDAELIYNLINEMFEDKTVTEFVIMSIAKCVAGGNNIEEFATFWLGKGGNGKGLLTTLVENVFGDYFFPLSYKIFTHIKEDNRSVELFEGRKKRYFSVSEPAKKFTMNSDTFKLWTGKDPVSVRNNYATKMTKYVPSTTNFQSNHHIQFDGDTSGESMIRRILAVMFPYLFKKEGDFDSNNSKHKKRDNTWKDKCGEDRYKRAFMCLLLTYYKDYRVNGLSIPEKIIEYSKDYTKHISPNKDWFDSNLVIDLKNGKNIGVKCLLNEFREDTKNTWKMKYFCEKLEEYGFELANGRAYSLDGNYQVGGNSTKHVKHVRFIGYDKDDDDDDSDEEIEEKTVEKVEKKVMTFTTSSGKKGNMKLRF